MSWYLNYKSEYLGKTFKAKRTVSAKSLSWNWLSRSREWSKLFFRVTVQFSLGSDWLVLDPRHKPICMARLAKLMNSDSCAWALRMSSTHLGLCLPSCWMLSVFEIFPALTLKRKHKSFKWESKQTGDTVNQSITDHDLILNIFQEYSLHTFPTSGDLIDLCQKLWCHVTVFHWFAAGIPLVIYNGSDNEHDGDH